MTAKFNVIGQEIKITASKEVLNELCLMLGEAERSYKARHGEGGYARVAGQYMDGIYDALNSTGYYD